jgi:tetratricopeptide (TPR) repeat protein
MIRPILVATLFLSLAGPALSQSGQRLLQTQGSEAGVCGIERRTLAGAMTASLASRMEDIYDLIGEERYDEAYPELEAMLERVGRNEYELAVVLQTMANVRMAQEREEDALALYERAIELDVMGNAQHFDMILMVANIHYSMDRFQEALDQLDTWFCNVPSDQSNINDVWVMKASLHAQLDEFRESITAVDRAIALADEPKEQWYQLKFAMHVELEEYRNAIDALKVLIDMSPDTKNYWLQMSALYMELDEAAASKSTLALAYRRDLLDRQSEFMQLASLFQLQDSPRQAAEVMEDGVARGIVENTRRNWEMIGGAWYEARELEKALIAYEKAGAVAEEGNIDLQRGFLLVDLERWDEARAAIDRALELGGLSESEQGNAYLLLGMSHMNLGDDEQAQSAFNQAANYSRVRQAAREWITHLRNERGRR